MNNTEPSLESVAVVPPETPTPLTDAAEARLGGYSVHLYGPAKDDLLALARQLEARAIAAERERDEARAFPQRIRALLKERSKGETETWGFVALFMEMIDEVEKSITQ